MSVISNSHNSGGGGLGEKTKNLFKATGLNTGYFACF